jgi:hypothetical protein
MEIESSVCYICPEPDAAIPLALIFYKFKVGITILGYGDNGMDEKDTGYD